MTTIAVMQPYFFPYAGYFRLFTAADVVVMFDCVQFPRRGWVHRNRFADTHGAPQWLTLPLLKASRDVRIAELRLPADVQSRLESAMQCFPVLRNALRNGETLLGRVLAFENDDASAYLCARIEEITSMLGMRKPMLRSSTLQVDPSLRGQDRVLAIVKSLGGERYVNPPGGRALYDHDLFSRAGVDLRFLPPYTAGMDSILSRLLTEPPEAISREIERETAFVQ